MDCPAGLKLVQACFLVVFPFLGYRRFCLVSHIREDYTIKIFCKEREYLHNFFLLTWKTGGKML